jgi:hypothetical protein
MLTPRVRDALLNVLGDPLARRLLIRLLAQVYPEETRDLLAEAVAPSVVVAPPTLKQLGLVEIAELIAEPQSHQCDVPAHAEPEVRHE